MIDPVIDEHFRRSLGADYIHLFEKKSMSPELVAATPSPNASPQPASSPSLSVKSNDSATSSFSIRALTKEPTPPPPTKQTVNIEMSVDDHFAKALGDTWKKLQEADRSAPSPSSSVHKKSDADDDDEGDDDDNSTDSAWIECDWVACDKNQNDNQKSNHAHMYLPIGLNNNIYLNKHILYWIIEWMMNKKRWNDFIVLFRAQSIWMICRYNSNNENKQKIPFVLGLVCNDAQRQILLSHTLFNI